MLTSHLRESLISDKLSKYNKLRFGCSPSDKMVNHAQPSDVTEGYAADWTVEQLREPAQRVADRIDELMDGRTSIDEAGG